MSRISRATVIAGLGTAVAFAPAVLRAQTATIRLGSSMTGDGYFLPFYGDQLGIFKQAGLAVEMVNFPNGGAIATGLAGRAIDVGFTDPINLANAVNRGVNWAFFAGGPLYASDAATTVLCVAPNSTVRSAKDLEGHAVGVVALASISALGVRAWLLANGADLNRVKLFELPFPTMVPAMNRGDIGAAFIAEPVLSQVKKDVRVLANAFDAIAKTFLIAACFTTRDWLAANPALAKRLAAAIDETTRYANAHQDETGVLLAKGSGLQIEVIHAMTRVRYGQIDPRLIQPILAAATKYGALEKPLNAADIVVKLT